MHWNNLAPYVEKNPQCTFVLIHFSLRYSEQEVQKFFDSMGEKKPKNIELWLVEPDQR
jgi:ribonuclease Z